jgi:CubicO group peptidase (beta-lactamase class C family)
MKIQIATIVLVTLVFNISDCFAQHSGISAKQIEEINTLVQKLAENDKFSGTVLIAKDQHVVYSKAIGMADKSKSNPVNLDTKFNLASMNKMFTSIAIAQLVEQKKLKFSDKIVQVLPILSKKIYGEITVHHLLTHTAGTGDIFRNPKFWDAKDTAKSISTYVSIGIDDPVRSKPGEKFEYSNYGYILLGAIIEKVSGTSYYDYVKRTFLM